MYVTFRVPLMLNISLELDDQFSYPVNLNWIQRFMVSVARLVIWAGAGVCRVLEPWFLGLKGLPFGAQRKLTRQAWVCQ